MTNPFLEFDTEDFSNTNLSNQSYAEIRRDAFTSGFMQGKAEGYDEGREDAIAEFLNLIIANQEIYDCTAESGDILIEDVKKLAEQIKERKND